MPREMLPTGLNEEKKILSQNVRMKLAKNLYTGVEFFVSLQFSSPRGDSRYWTLEWSSQAWRFSNEIEGMEENAWGGLSCNNLIHDIRPATESEIAWFKETRARVEAKQRGEEYEEAKLLSLCGLVHSQFVRFRQVYKADDGKHLIVETRENGIGERSVKAIRNKNYVDSMPDRRDTTYEYYRFRIPEMTANKLTKP